MAEQRLIDAEALYKKVLERPVTNVDGYGYINHIRVLEMIDNEPTIEAKPVVHAHWNIVVDKGDSESFPEDLEYPQCSNPKCGKISMVKSEFCPHCGAQMDEEINDDQ